MGKKIRILLLSANPPDTGIIRVDEEAREISDKLDEGSYRDRFELITHQAVRPSDLQRYLLKYRPHIVHFSGHGSATDEATIILEGTSRESTKIEPQQIVNLFRVFTDSVRVVVLNACWTEPHARAIAQVIDYAIGTNGQIGDRASVTFAGAFYRALAFGRSVQEAFNLATIEVELNRLQNSVTHELFVREGTDLNEAFLLPIKAISRRVSKRLPRIAQGHAVTYAPSDVGGSVIQAATRMGGDADRRLEEAIVEKHTGNVEVVGGIGMSLPYTMTTVPSRRVQNHRLSSTPRIGPTLFEQSVVGREDALAEVKRRVQVTAALEANVNLTVVRGWPGVGKTALAEVVGRDPDIQKVFPDGVLWTSLGLKPELTAKLAEWARRLGADDAPQTHTLDEAVAKLAALMHQRRMLLVVDDVWAAAHVMPFLRAAAGGRSALLVTTRMTKVARALAPNNERIYTLPPLAEDDALTLLRHRVPSIVEQHQAACLGLVRDLGCSPLAIQVAARLLQEEASMGLDVVEFIHGIREGAVLLSELAPLSSAEGDRLPTINALLGRSTDALDQQTRECFTLLGTFAPKPAIFTIDAMRATWEVQDPTPVVRNLVGHGLLEPIGAGRFQADELLIKHARSLLRDEHS